VQKKIGGFLPMAAEIDIVVAYIWKGCSPQVRRGLLQTTTVGRRQAAVGQKPTLTPPVQDGRIRRGQHATLLWRLVQFNRGRPTETASLRYSIGAYDRSVLTV